MNVFERLVADEMVRRAGPEPVVDDAAIFTTITSTRSPKRRFESLFSATKFVVAGAIVALFGGFLLAAVLTQPSQDLAPAAVTPSRSPVATDGMLSHLVTEEVEPGVLHVLDDGAGHDLVAQPPLGLAVSPEGAVWVFDNGNRPWSDDGTFDSMFALGRADSEVGFDQRMSGNSIFADVVIEDGGTAWAKLVNDGTSTLSSFDGASWTEFAWPDGSSVGAIEAMPDGAILVTADVKDGPGPKAARIEDGEWTVLPTLDGPALEGSYHGAPNKLAVAPDGTIWLSNGFLHTIREGTSPRGVLRFDGNGWEVLEIPVSDDGDEAGPLAVGPDGTLWVYFHGGNTLPGMGNPYLARWTDGVWSVFSKADGVPQLVTFQGWESRFEVDRDGTLWMPYRGELKAPLDGTADRCPGVLSFDGGTWTQYLEGHCGKNDLGVAPDGSVWVTSDGDLYVITPEVVTRPE